MHSPVSMIIRNDDVAADTRLDHLKAFCDVCDQAGVTIMHAITPMGICIGINRDWDNLKIIEAGRGRELVEHIELIDYLRGRPDIIAVHGLYHTHVPSVEEIETARILLSDLGLTPTYFVPPFNEGDYGGTVCGLDVSADDAVKIESCIVRARQPGAAEIGYLHSWRFDPECPTEYRHPRMKQRFTLKDLEAIL